MRTIEKLTGVVLEVILMAGVVILMCLTTSCSDDIGDESKIDLNKTVIDSEIARALADGDYYASYIFKEKKIYESDGEDGYLDVTNAHWSGGNPYWRRTKIIINGDEIYATENFAWYYSDMIYRAKLEFGDNIFPEESQEKLYVRSSFNYDLLSSKIKSQNQKLYNNYSIISLDENKLIITDLGNDGIELFDLFYYLRIEDIDTSSLKLYNSDKELYEQYYEPKLRELFGDRYDELLEEYKQIPD